MKHMLQNTVPGDVLDNPNKSDSRPAIRATIYGKRHDIRRLTVYILNAWSATCHKNLVNYMNLTEQRTLGIEPGTSCIRGPILTN